MRIHILGAGVSGLSTAIRLREAGHAVKVLARARGETLVSSVAAAIWHPYNVSPIEKAGAWAAASYAEFVHLASDKPEAGVRLREGLELFVDPPAERAWWTEAVPGLREARAEDLPEGFGAGYAFRAPVIEMPRYLAWLEARLLSSGAGFETVEAESLDAAIQGCDALVNCSGLAARELAGDALLAPIRGQVLWLRQCGVERFLLDHHGPRGMRYIIPRSRDIVLGGTYEPGATDLRPDPATAEAILARCQAIEPRLRGAEVLAHRVGLRPGRPAVRLESLQLAGKPLVHNYGHGGAGVTLSWGCADAVVMLLGAAPGAR